MVAAIHGHTEVPVRDEYNCRGPGGISICQHKSSVVIVHRYPEWTPSRADVHFRTCTRDLLCPEHWQIKIQFSGLVLNMVQVAIQMCKTVSQLMKMQLDAESFRT
jgi:hypothetical protein